MRQVFMNIKETLKEYELLTQPPALAVIIEQAVTYIEELELKICDLKDIYEPEWRDET
jgi:hypothetical protein